MMMKATHYWLLCGSCGILLIIIPLLLLASSFPPIEPNIYSDSSLKIILQNSITLYVLHLSCVISILPSVVEVALDILENNAAYLSSIHTNERFLFCAAVCIFSSLFLAFRSSEYITLIYTAEFNCRNILILTLLLVTGHSELVKDSILLKGNIIMSTLATFSTVFSTNCMFYYHVYAVNQSVALGLNTAIKVMNAFIFCIFIYLNLYRWSRLCAINQNSCVISFNRLTIGQKRYALTILPVVGYTIFRMVWFFVTTGYGPSPMFWQYQSESTIIADVCASYLCLASIAIITGRVIRDLVVAKVNSLKLKQSFVRHVSHEIRSPLNVVHAGLDLLMAEIKEAEPEADTVPISRNTAELIRHIFSSSESAIDLLNDLLQYEQLDAGILNLELSWRGLDGSLRNKLDWAQILADSNGVTLTISDSTLATTGSPCAVEGDAEQGGSSMGPDLLAQMDAYLHIDVFRMDQVIRNMITNATKFTPAGGRVQVNISCELQNQENRNKIISKFGVDVVGMLRLEVVDTGVGLSPDDQKKIFGEFTQFNKDELQGGGGSGLGLWISKKIVQMHKGNMGATSVGLGCGTTVYFELPLFCAAMAGKTPLAPFNTLTSHSSPPQQPATTTTATELWTSEGVKPPSSPLLVSPAIVVGDTPDDDAEDVDSTPSLVVRRKPKPGIINAWKGDSEVVPHQFLQQSFRIEPMQDIESRTEVSQALDFGSSKEDDEPPLLLPSLMQPDPQMSFLIVDDSSLNRKVVVRLIESEKKGRLKNARLLEADDGTTAVETLRREMSEGRQVDFVLMDYVMVRMHGPEAASIMRNDMNYTGTIIAITGNALPEDMAKFIASGANEVLTKPLTKMKLMTAIARFMSPP